MTKSMTAYSQAIKNTDFGEISCELRSVNHRYLDIAPRIPDELRIFEAEIKEVISSSLTRGRIDCFIRLQENEVSALLPNQDIAENLQSMCSDLKKHIPEMQDLRAIDVLRWPGILQAKKIEPAQMKEILLQVVKSASRSLVEAREVEGAKMAELILLRLNVIEKVINDIKAFLPEIAVAYRQRIEEKLVDIREQLDPARVEQEMVIFLQKSDVAEEIDRLNVHVKEVGNILNKNEPSGRRLDFLMQELNREANTLGSKAQDTRLTNAAVDLKVLIEQMREQVQNIE